jgi:CheY-like chemotaxis protein
VEAYRREHRNEITQRYQKHGDRTVISKKVVLVDDEEDIVLYLQTALEDAGLTALTASNASDGLRLIRVETPDLVCLDILMPGESGMSLYQKLRSDPALENIPVLITSGFNLSKELGDIDYRLLPDGTRVPEPEGIIEKPLTAEQFITAVNSLIGRNDGAHC